MPLIALLRRGADLGTQTRPALLVGLGGRRCVVSARA
jgi:hypothetical protein